MENEVFKYYLLDLGILLKELALEAKQNKKTSSDAEDAAYKSGYLMAFHVVIDLMKQQANAFQIDQKDINLDDIDAERDLL